MTSFNILGIDTGSKVEIYLIDRDILHKRPAKAQFRGRCVRCENINSFKNMSDIQGMTLVVKELTPEGRLKLHIPKKLFPTTPVPAIPPGLGVHSNLSTGSGSSGNLTIGSPSAAAQRKTHNIATANLASMLGHNGDIELVETEELDAIQLELEKAAEARQELADMEDFEPEKTEESAEKEEVGRDSTRPLTMTKTGDVPGLKLLTNEKLEKAKELQRVRFMSLTEDAVNRGREDSRQAYLGQILAGVVAFRLRLVNIEFFIKQLVQKTT